MPSVVCPVLAYIMEIMTLAFCQNMCTAVPALARETSIQMLSLLPHKYNTSSTSMIGTTRRNAESIPWFQTDPTHAICKTHETKLTPSYSRKKWQVSLQGLTSSFFFVL